MRNGFNSAEMRVLRDLKNPVLIQSFLDCEVRYNKEENGVSCRSPRRVLRDRVAHCMEGALFAAAALEVNGAEPMLVDLKAIRDDDPGRAVSRVDRHWGAIAKSNYASLRFREPVYRTVRELVMSYFEHYHNLDGEKTLRAHSRPIGLKRFGTEWMTAEEDVWEIPEYLCTLKHTPVISYPMMRRLSQLDDRLRASEKFGMRL